MFPCLFLGVGGGRRCPYDTAPPILSLEWEAAAAKALGEQFGPVDGSRPQDVRLPEKLMNPTASPGS